MSLLNLNKGRFSSSQMYNLIPFGKVKMNKEELAAFKAENPKSRVTTKEAGFASGGLTYISKKDREFKLQRSLSSNIYSRPIYWGYVMEIFCMAELGITYEHNAPNYPTEHPDMKYFWSGVVDAKFKNGIAEIKSYQLDGFSKYADCLKEYDISLFKKEYPQEYWQIVSGSILENVEFGEAIAFVPYLDDLENYRQIISDSDFCEKHGFEPWQLRFIVESNLKDLPYVVRGQGYYENITKFRFRVPQEDKDLLTSRVKEARELLLKYDLM